MFIRKNTEVLVLILILFFGVSTTSFAFNGPSVNPPGGNGLLIASGTGTGLGVNITPSALFDVYGQARITESGGSGRPALKFYPSGQDAWQVLSDNFGLSLYDITDAQYRLTIDQAGHVGIATTTPSATYALSVVGNILTTSGFYGNGANLSGISPASIAGGAFSSANYAFPLSLAVGTNVTAGLPANGLYVVGSVGIGDTSPSQKLVVVGNVSSTGFCLSGNCISSWPISQWTTAGANIYYNTGNVGIGDATPSQKLVVVGNVSSTGFCLNGSCIAAWPSSPVTSVFGRAGAVVAVSGDYNTLLVTENAANLYFTNARAQAAITGGASTIVTSNLTINRALLSDASGKVGVSAATNIELGYLSGVTSLIQNQLNSKAGTTNQTFTGTTTITNGNLKLSTVGNGVAFPDNSVQTTAYTGGVSNISAAYLTQGTFGSNAAGSNNQYVFKPQNNTTALLQAQGSGGAVIFDIDATNSRVGVANAAPAYPLDVTGDLRFTGTLQGGSVPWARLTAFPATCPAGQAVTTIAGVPTCTAFGSGNGTVTSVGTGAGLTGGPITTSGNLSLSINGGATQTCGGGQYVSQITAAGIVTCGTPAGGVGGSGTASYLARWTAANALGNSVIYDNGTNVGIGTATPQVKLQVNTGGATAANDYFYVNHTSNTTGGFYYGGNTQGLIIGNYGVSNWPGTNGLIVGGNTYLAAASGNVGIGTASPGNKLDVIGGITTRGTAGNGNYISMVSTGGGHEYDLYGDSPSVGYWSVYDRTAGATRFIIDSGGNVGVGTSPVSKLNVSGGDLQVETGEGRFKGWYNAGTGLAAEIGLSSGQGYIITYNRTTSAYSTTNITGSTGLNVAFSTNVVITGVAGVSSPMLDIRSPNGGPWALRFYRTDLGAGPQLYAADGNTLYQSGIFIADNSIRSPIFYDMDNTGYYVDPASSSYMNTIILGGGSSSNWATVNVGGVGLNVAGTIYSYSGICVNNNSGTCNSSAGVVLGMTNGSAYTNLPSSGNSIIGGALTINSGGSGSKLTVGTVDPVYTIGGEHYATYSPETTGVKVETTGMINLKSGKAVIDFEKLDKGSDLWLFAQAINFNGRTFIANDGQIYRTTSGEVFNNISVLLTTSFDGNVWYEKNAADKTLTVFGSRDGEVSYRLSAPRFDSAEWTNQAKESIEGFNLDKLLK